MPLLCDVSGPGFCADRLRIVLKHALLRSPPDADKQQRGRAGPVEGWNRAGTTEPKCPGDCVHITVPGIPACCDRYSATVISAATQSTGRDVAGGIYGAELSTFPPCSRVHCHLPWRDTPASSGIRPGLRGPGLSQRQPRFVAPENWVERLRRKQELGERGSLNTAVEAALCWMAGVSADLREREPNIRWRLFKLKVCVVAEGCNFQDNVTLMQVTVRWLSGDCQCSVMIQTLQFNTNNPVFLFQFTWFYLNHSIFLYFFLFYFHTFSATFYFKCKYNVK